MKFIILAALLTGSPAPAASNVTPQQALTAIADEAQTGSLIVSKGDCLAVKIFSGSSYTHIAAVVEHDGEMLVYDSTGGAGVRKQSLGDYLTVQNDQTLHFFHPRNPLSPSRARRFQEHLESQLGRPYAIHHHLTGNRTAGLHCSEYVTDALIAADLLRAKQPPRVSPASLVVGILKAELYEPGAVVHLIRAPLEPPACANWCSRLWFDTKVCTRTCFSKLRGWFFCK